MAAASMRSHSSLTCPTAIGDCVAWRSAQRPLVRTSHASATKTRARRSRFACQRAWHTHDLAASDNSSAVGEEPNAGCNLIDPQLHPALNRRLGTGPFSQLFRARSDFGRCPSRKGNAVHHKFLDFTAAVHNKCEPGLSLRAPIGDKGVVLKMLESGRARMEMQHQLSVLQRDLRPTISWILKLSGIGVQFMRRMRVRHALRFPR